MFRSTSARDTLRRLVRHERKPNGNPTTHVDAIWQMRDRALNQSNLDRRYEVIITKRVVCHVDRMARKFHTFAIE